ncbi:hypothetical protein BCVP_CDS0014 [Bacillus phage BC-VP]|nr:hypothetical protein BCVP_CDS0014 [Bacillus phage BC-VP]
MKKLLSYLNYKWSVFILLYLLLSTIITIKYYIKLNREDVKI